MSNLFIRRAFTVLAILAFLAVSTAALTHGHSDAKSVNDSHCALCMAVHSATHAVATPVATLYFPAAQVAYLAPCDGFLLAFVQPLLNKDRAPPQF
jgi:hypothetical protein